MRGALTARLCIAHSFGMTKPQDIISVREKRRWSQAALGEFIGVDQGTVSKWERAKAKPSGSAARLLDLLIHDRISPEAMPAGFEVAE